VEWLLKTSQQLPCSGFWCSDYRIPQLLRTIGVLRYDHISFSCASFHTDSTVAFNFFASQLLPSTACRYNQQLAAAVDSKQELHPASDEEIAIRAATVHTVELIRQHLTASSIVGGPSRAITSVQLDWILWERGEKLLHTLGPHHRVLTVYY